MNGLLQKIGVVCPHLPKTPLWSRSGANATLGHNGGVERWKVNDIGWPLVIQGQALNGSKLGPKQSHEYGLLAHIAIKMRKMYYSVEENSHFSRMQYRKGTATAMTHVKSTYGSRQALFLAVFPLHHRFS